MSNISHQVDLTSSEIANLWSQYINDSMSICVLSYYLQHVKDPDIRSILEFALKLSQTHIEKLRVFFEKENYPIPQGFTESDVNLDAPKLFTDVFMLVYIYIMTIHGLTGYAGAVSTSIRSDQINYFIKCNTEAMELYSRVLEVLVRKGIVSRPPKLIKPNGIDFVDKQNFITGWFGNRRPLNAVEVSGLFFNMKKNALKVALEIGFCQVAQTKEILKYFQRGADICNRHFDELGSILSDTNLPSPKKFNDEITRVTTPPFSEKLMLFHIVALVSTASGYYGAAFSLSQRRDLATKYAILTADIMKYAEDGVNILIDKGWLEQPPTFIDRKGLSGKNK